MAAWPMLVKLCVSQMDVDGTINLSALDKYKKDVNETTNTGSTPLHFVVLGDNLSLAKWLVDNGAVIQNNNDNQTPLHWACKKGNIEMVKLLLSIMTTEEALQKDIDNTKALDWAVEYEHLEVIKLFKTSKIEKRKYRRRISPIFKRFSLGHIAQIRKW